MTPQPHPKTVLIVEDIASLRDAIAGEFEFLDWHSIGAENGADALEKWKANQTIDLIISDIRMPVSDGPQFLDALRKITTQEPPFIFMTGFSDLQIYDALDRGADLVIGKPINPDQLAIAIGELAIPLEHRWQKLPNSPQRSTLLSNTRFDELILQFGRSGFFIAADAFPGNVLVNEIVSFEIDCPVIPSGTLSGLGKIIWSRLNDLEGLIVGHGVQFIHLNEPGRAEFIQWVNASQTSSTIPRGSR